MSVSERGGRDLSGGGTAPLYKRLPKGPHGLGRQQVIHHQRIRMHGAMIEAVTTDGYEQTSVKQVIALAGVSRRAFYEQFANKEHCFLETFDLIVARAIKRINQAYRSNPGSVEHRMRAGFKAFIQEVESNSKALHLVVVDAQTAGPEGLGRLRKTTTAFEHLLSRGFSVARAIPGNDRRALSESVALAPSVYERELREGTVTETGPAPADRASSLPASALEPTPPPVVKAIVGGLRRTVFLRLRDGNTEGLTRLSDEMLRWTLLFQSTAVERLQLRPCAKAPFPPVAQLELRDARNPRERLMRSVLNLSLREEYEELSPPWIAEEAGSSVESFLELFLNKEDCYLAALDMLGDEILGIVADPGLVSSDWAQAVCRTLDAFTDHLASNPVSTVTIASRMFAAGEPAIERMIDLSHDVATLLTEGAPRRARSKLVVEGVAGALWHTLYCEVSAGRAHLLPALADYLSYVVLAPFIGPTEAASVIVAWRSAAPQNA
jgi:AcrR family transcriptional regulator